MDRTELINQLENFKKACSEISGIDLINQSAFTRRIGKKEGKIA